MAHTDTILYDVIEKVHDKLTKIGIKIPKHVTITVIIVSFSFMMFFEYRNMLKDILKCDENGVMGSITITPNIPHKGRRRMTSDWLRVNGIGVSFNVVGKLDKLIKRTRMYSAIETPGKSPVILRPDPIVVLMIMNMVIIIMAEIATDLGITRIGLSQFSATNYDNAWVIVNLQGGRIQVEI